MKLFKKQAVLICHLLCFLTIVNAQLQNVKAPFTGAIQRSAADKIFDIITVEDFGASGIDDLDDTKAFIAAINAGHGKTINLRGGTYHLNLSIESSNVHIMGNGATLKPTQANKPVITMGSNKYLNNIRIENLVIIGANRNSDGIFITNNSIYEGVDFVQLMHVKIEQCRYGLNISGRCIWSKFEQCVFDWNQKGLHLETGLPCNLLYFSNCTFNNNTIGGAWVNNLNGEKETFKTLQFVSCNFEGNGAEYQQAYGAYFSGVESLIIENAYYENNGINQSGSYGLKITGAAGRGLQITGGWYVGSKYPIYIDGPKKWGAIQGVTAQSSNKEAAAIIIKAAWVNDEPKIHLQNCFGIIETQPDEQGNLPTPGIDWHTGEAATLNFANRNWLKIYQEHDNQRITKINGLYPGKQIGIINYTVKNLLLTIDASLMETNRDYIIKPNETKQFIVDGYPATGKLRVL